MAQRPQRSGCKPINYVVQPTRKPNRKEKVNAEFKNNKQNCFRFSVVATETLSTR